MTAFKRYINDSIGTIGPHTACVLLRMWMGHQFHLTETEYELLWDLLTDFLEAVNDEKYRLEPDTKNDMEFIAQASFEEAGRRFIPEDDSGKGQLP